VLMAFQAKDGQFLWQDVAPRVGARSARVSVAFDDKHAVWKGTGCTMSPAECQLRPRHTGGRHRGSWTCGRLGVFRMKPPIAMCCPWVIR
jgi:hypothetical protein